MPLYEQVVAPNDVFADRHKTVWSISAWAP